MCDVWVYCVERERRPDWRLPASVEQNDNNESKWNLWSIERRAGALTVDTLYLYDDKICTPASITISPVQCRSHMRNGHWKRSVKSQTVKWTSAVSSERCARCWNGWRISRRKTHVWHMILALADNDCLMNEKLSIILFIDGDRCSRRDDSAPDNRAFASFSPASYFRLLSFGFFFFLFGKW